MPPKRKSGGRSASAPVAKKGRLAKRSAQRDEDSSDSDLDDFGTDSSDSDDDDDDDDDDDEFDPEKLIADDDDMAYLNGLDEVEREAILAERYEKKLEELELKKAAKEQKRLQAQEKGGKKKAAQDEGADAIALPPPPKRPMSAYLYFCADNRPAVSKTSTKLGDVSKELARLWKEAEGGREKWEAMAAEAKKKHELEKAVWDKECEKLRERAAMGGVVNPGVMPSGKETKKKAANKKKKKNEKQEKPPRAPSAYMIFCSEKRKSVMEMTNDDGEKLSFGEVTKTLAAQWKALGEDEKKIYTEKQKLQAAEVQAKEN